MKRKLTLLALSILLAIGEVHAQGNLWGMTSAGVADNKGVIFKTNADGTGYAVQYNFVTDFPGASPQNALTELNGKLYGMTDAGGANDVGLIFEYDPSNGNYVDKFDFTFSTSGAFPTGGFVVGVNGHLYGMTSSGGATVDGTLFEYDPVGNVFTKKFDFSSAVNGSNPHGSLILATNGKMYGMTYQGGANDAGVLFEYDPATSSPVNRFDFSSTNGSSPYGDLVQFTTNGKLYGMTSTGGTASSGVLFEFDIVTGYTKKLDFSGAANGASPFGGLIQASDGKLYGMTLGGGSNGQGVIFSYNPTGNTYTKKLDLSASAGFPQGTLFQNSGGLFYGMTLDGGSNGDGTLFEYDATGNTLTIKYNFSSALSGANPQSSLIKASNGKLYGMTPYGNPTNNGVLFEYDPSSSTFTKKLDFSNASNGSNPQGGLVQAPNGLLYAMTSSGGANNRGVLFELDPSSSSYNKKVDFNTTNGAFPTGGLVLASDNKLYGMTPYGGTNGDGVLFQYNPGSTAVVPIINFLAASSGANPQGSLVAAPNGKLYGMTSQGGASGHGVLFEFDPSSSSFASKYTFITSAAGTNPGGSLNLAANGKLYGMTNQGGTAGSGVIFEYDPASNIYTKKIDFTGTNGAHPSGDLVQASNGKLYGLTSGGGANSVGVLFEFDPAAVTLTVKLDLVTPTTGSNPVGNLVEVASGKLYGMNSAGGTQAFGVLFEYDFSNTTFTNRVNFDGVSGASPQFGSLLLVPGKQNQIITFNALPSKVYNDPPFALGATITSGLVITYTSSDPTIASIAGNIVTINNFGTVTITASQGGDESYNFALSKTQPLVITQASQTITFNALPTHVYGDAPFTISATSDSGLPVTFASSDATVATVSGTTVTIIKVGPVNIIASQAGNTFYSPAPDVPRALTINKADQTITFAPPPSGKKYGDPTFSLTASSTSGLPITFTEPLGIVSFSGSVVTILGAATTTITASQPGDGNYNAALTVPRVLTIDKADQTITFNSLTPVTFGVAPFTLPGTASSGLALSYASSDPSVATISGTIITILKAGSTDITPSQVGNPNYNPAPPIGPPAFQTLVVNKASQTITFSALSAKIVTDPPFTLSATASSGLTISYVSGNTAVATISGNVVTIVGVGTSTITASQIGNGNYLAATSVDQPLVVNPKASQTITFGALPPKLISDPPFSLSATASSGLAVSYVSGNNSVATISGSTVTIVGVGTTTITASQGGNSAFNPAPSVNQDLVVNPKASQTITFGALPSKLISDPPFSLGATASSGLAVSYVSGNTSVATISGNTVTIVGVGTTTITASQGGDASFNSAPSVNQDLVVNPKASQTITFGGLPLKTFGDPAFSLTATASSGLAVSYVSGNITVATISGSTVTIVGAGTTTITASQSGNSAFNPAPSVNQNLIVQKGNQTITFPAVTSPALSDPTFTVNATASSGLVVSFIAITTDKFSINGNAATPLLAGNASIRAQQIGNANYNAAATVDQVFCIRPAKPVITVTNPTSGTPTLTSSSSVGNVWFLDGLQITGANNASLLVTKSGSYTVAVVAESCLSDLSDPKAMVITGDLPATTDGARLFPNPAKDKLFVDLSKFSPMPVELKIIDLTGRNIHRQSTTGGGTVEINVADHPTGMYVLFLLQGNKTAELRYIKN